MHDVACEELAKRRKAPTMLLYMVPSKIYVYVGKDLLISEATRYLMNAINIQYTVSQLSYEFVYRYFSKHV